MTDVEIRICKALEGVSLGLDNRARRFVMSMTFDRNRDREITAAQSLYLSQLAWKYRRQMPQDVVMLAALKGGVSDRKDRRKTAAAAT